MSNYIVSARKYRPETFRSVLGQQALTHTLKAAIDSGRLAHAYLFCGPRGVGKTSCARIFAKTINCLSPTPEGEACNKCESCQAFNEQRSYNIIELDAASNNSVDDIRGLIEQVQIPPQIGTYRVFIIDEVHMLSTAAFNAFLKTLEEPPKHAIFILATTEKQKIIPTILSRCQIYDFARITINDMVAQMSYIAEQEGITVEPAALNVIAQKADGAMRDALSVFDQVAASTLGNITYQSTIDNLNVLDHEYYFRLMVAFRTCNVPEALLIYKEIRDRGFDSLFFINGLAQHLRNMMVALTPSTKVLLEMSDDVAARFVAEAPKYHPKFYYRALDLCNTCDLNYRTASSKQLLVELTLVKLCQILDPTPPLGLEPPQKLKKVAAATPPATSTQAAVAQQRPATTASAAPQPATPPAAASADAPPAQARRHAPISITAAGNTPSISIRNMMGNGTVQAASEPTSTYAPDPQQSAPFSEKQLAEAWQKYIDTHPADKVITATMLSAKPQKVSETLYQIAVDSPGKADFFNTRKAAIMNFLRQQVGNNNLEIEVKVSPSEQAPTIWSPREIVEDMAKNNPSINTLIDKFQLGIA